MTARVLFVDFRAGVLVDTLHADEIAVLETTAGDDPRDGGEAAQGGASATIDPPGATAGAAGGPRPAGGRVERLVEYAQFVNVHNDAQSGVHVGTCVPIGTPCGAMYPPSQGQRLFSRFLALLLVWLVAVAAWTVVGVVGLVAGAVVTGAALLGWGIADRATLGLDEYRRARGR